MAAYVIVEIRIEDPVRYEDYKKMASQSIAAHGGSFLVRGGAVESLEGGWVPSRMVVLQFPTAKQAKEWWSSADYGPAKKLRHETATTKMILVEGL